MLVYFLMLDGKEQIFKEKEKNIFKMFFFFLQRNYLNNTVDDIKNPKRVIPRSIVISLLISIIVYLLTFSSYFTVLSIYDILISEATAVTFAEQVFPPFLYILPIGVTMSCIGGKYFYSN